MQRWWPNAAGDGWAVTQIVATSMYPDENGVTCGVCSTGPAGPVGAASERAVLVPRTISLGAIEAMMLALERTLGASTNLVESLPVRGAWSRGSVPRA
jgi:hypothetical protein